MQTYPSWAAQVNSDEGGQWLTHLEAGLEVDGASPEEPVGVDLFLPDEIGTQEIASQVQPLLSTTAGSQGVRAQQLDWSQAQVVILEADQEEATALVVVPEVDSTAGQALLPGGIDFDLDGAVHTAVKVQRVSAGSGARGRWQLTPTPLAELPVIKPVPKPIITAPRLPAPKPAPPSPSPAPAPVAKKGIELLKPTLPYCPAPYLGRAGVVSRLQCMNYDERWLEKQWEYETRPALYTETAQLQSQVSQALNKPGISFFPDPRMSVLLAGFKKVDLQTVQTLRDLALKRGYLQGSEVESQGVDLLCASIGVGLSLPPPFNFVTITLAGISLCSGEVYSFIQQFLRRMNDLPDPTAAWSGLFQDLAALQAQCPDPSSCVLSQFIQNNPNWQDPQNHPGLNELVGSMVDFVRKITGNNNLQASLVNNFLQYFLYQVKDQALMSWMVQQFGPVGVLAVGWIDGLRAQGVLNPGAIDSSLSQFPYPDGVSFFQAVKALYEQAGSLASPDLIRRDLQNLTLALVIWGAGRETEKFYRVQEAARLATQLLSQGQGWRLERIWYSYCEYIQQPSCEPDDSYIDVIATQGDKLVAYIMIEPFLSSDDISNECTTDPRACTNFERRLINAIDIAKDYYCGAIGAYSGECVNNGRDRVVVIKLTAADPAALERLKSQIQAYVATLPFGLGPVTIIVVLNGQVVYSLGQHEGDAAQICLSLGICSSQPVASTPPEESPPPSDGPAFTITGTTVNSCSDSSSGVRFTVGICAQ